MFLNKLSIYSKSEIIREIEFHRGINLIIDETPDEFKGSIQSTGNNVGKTTVLRLIDYCFGADGKSIYQDTEFKNQPNTTIKDFLKEKEVIIHLELLVDLNDENSEKIVIRRNFLARKKKIQELNGVNYTDNKEFDFELKKIIFKTEVDKPTFRQIISKNIRDEKGKMANIVKVLNPYTSKEEYEALYLFWLGISTETLDEKQRLSAEKTKEENFQKRLKKEGELSLIEQQLRFVSSKILELDKQKENFNLNENYAADIQKLNDVKYALNRVSTELSRLEVRRDLIEESKADLEKEHVEINTSQIKSLYDKANALISNLQVSFEETVKFHNDLITEKLDYITKELPELDKAVDKLRNELNRLRGLEDTLTTKLRNTGVAEDLENIVIELNKQYERKGKLEEQKRLWISSTDKIKNISAKLSEINEKILSKDDLIQSRISEFNTYFSVISNELYGEYYLLSSVPTEKGYDLIVTNLEGNPSTGKKKGQIAAFDFAYIKFADALEINCLHFILHDQLENIHDNQLTTIIDVANNLNGQYIVPILRDKVPSNIDINEFEVISLSQTDKLFRI
jgi:uncharacterized protein YydD (DUF2326 family)